MNETTSPMSPTAVTTCPEEITQPPLAVTLAAPRGFCAGVERAIRAVEEALTRFGAPVYVRHEIVHNVHVVERLKCMGAVFIEDMEDAPSDRPIILSAHGSPAHVHDTISDRGMTSIDATCPLVSKVHNRAKRLAEKGYHIILIGHDGHQEVVGTQGQVADTEMSLVETVEQAQSMIFPDAPLAYVTQTTLSVDETTDIIATLKTRFPDIVSPAKADICYATSNRQDAIKAISPDKDLVIVIGSATSSNSKRMVEVAREAGAQNAVLTDDAASFDWSLLRGLKRLAISAGASAPEDLVEEFLLALSKRYALAIDTLEVAQEAVTFKMPVAHNS
ncbi:MAG: 4-hydroxy-3-methylbut-2-enyl diphosphate reductase [Pseudomonadota bacterium]